VSYAHAQKPSSSFCSKTSVDSAARMLLSHSSNYCDAELIMHRFMRTDAKIQNSNLGAKQISHTLPKATLSTMLWVDKYRPNSLSKLDVNSQLTERLKAMVSEMQSCSD
jgi:hypothetical protein